MCVGAYFVDFQPFVPVLVAFVLGIVADATWGSSEEIQFSISPLLWGWLSLFLVSTGAFAGMLWFFHWKKARSAPSSESDEPGSSDGFGESSGFGGLEELKKTDGLKPEEPEEAEGLKEAEESQDLARQVASCPSDSSRQLVSFRQPKPLARSEISDPQSVSSAWAWPICLPFVKFICGFAALGTFRSFIGLRRFCERFFGKTCEIFHSSAGLVPLQNTFLLLSIFALGGAYHHFYWNIYSELEISRNIQDPFSLEFIEGKVVRAPEVVFPPAQFGNSDSAQEPTTKFLLKVSARKTVAGWQDASGMVLVRVHGLLLDTHVGDVLQISGRLGRFSEAANPKAFSAKRYYRQQRILAFLRVPSPGNVQRIARPGFWGILRTVEYLRSVASRQLEQFLTPETKPMAAALILGSREEVDPEEMEMMIETGTIHLMAISGLHVGLLAGGCFLLARLLRLGNLSTALFVIALVWLYVLVSGSRPPALRAGIIVAMSTLSFLWERGHSHLNALAAAGVFVLLVNPTSIFSTGTQLSFLAVGALLSAPVLKDRSLKKYVEKKDGSLQVLAPEFLFVRGAPHAMIVRLMVRRFLFYLLNLFYSSFLMTLVLLPLTLGNFHVVAVVGVFLNVFIWLPLTIAMTSGAAVLFLGGQPIIGPFLGWLCSASLAAMNEIIAFGAQIPGHCFWMRGTPVFWNLILYVVLISWAVFPKTRLKSKKNYALFVLVMFLLLTPFLSESIRRKGELRCSFISVSHGLSVLLQFPNGKTVLYDAGQFAPEEYPARTISAFLWNSGVRRLDSVFISHPDMDHYNALSGLLKRFSVTEVFVSPQTLSALEKSEEANLLGKSDAEGNASSQTVFSLESGLSLWGEDGPFAPERKTPEEVREQTAVMLRDLYAAFKKWNVPIRTTIAGDRIIFDPDCSVTVLHPTRVSLETYPEHTNGNSLVLLLEYEGKRFLLTGDLAPPGLEYFLELEPISCDVVLAPHHGAKNCCSPEFIKWCSPKNCVVSESFNNRQKQTVEYLQNAGARVFHTGREGAVIFRVRGGKLDVFTRKEWMEWN